MGRGHGLSCAPVFPPGTTCGCHPGGRKAGLAAELAAAAAAVGAVSASGFVTRVVVVAAVVTV